MIAQQNELFEKFVNFFFYIFCCCWRNVIYPLFHLKLQFTRNPFFFFLFSFLSLSFRMQWATKIQPSFRFFSFCSSNFFDVRTEPVPYKNVTNIVLCMRCYVCDMIYDLYNKKMDIVISTYLQHLIEKIHATKAFRQHIYKQE